MYCDHYLWMPIRHLIVSYRLLHVLEIGEGQSSSFQYYCSIDACTKNNEIS